MLDSINNINRKIKKEEQICYNLSKKGAYIEQSIPVLFEELNLKSIHYDINILKRTLTENSFKGLKVNLLENLENDKNILEKIIEKLNSYSHIYTLNKKYLRITIKTVIENILKDDFKTYEIKKIYLNYLNTINVYLNYYLNDKNVKLKEIELEKIKEIYLSQLKKMTNNFLTLINDVTS